MFISKTITCSMRRVGNILLLGFLCFFYLTVCFWGFVMLLLLHLIFGRSKLRENVDNAIKQIWVFATKTFLGFYFYEPIQVSFDIRIMSVEKSVFISNHITMFDWWYFIVLLCAFDKFNSCVIILKNSLKKVPVFGYSMTKFGYIFLKRSLKVDLGVLKEKLLKINERKSFSVLLFPEGTVIEEESQARSIKFAKENDIKVHNLDFCHDRVLLPKKSGFKVVLEELVAFDSLIDFTICTIPYEKQPYNSTSFYDIFIARKKNLKLFFMIDFYKKNKEIYETDFLYKIFARKNFLLEKIEGSGVTNLEALSCVHKEFLGKDRVFISTKEINMVEWSCYGFLALFYLSLIGILGYTAYILKK